jgi:hypothetical protein
MRQQPFFEEGTADPPHFAAESIRLGTSSTTPNLLTCRGLQPSQSTSTISQCFGDCRNVLPTSRPSVASALAYFPNFPPQGPTCITLQPHSSPLTDPIIWLLMAVNRKTQHPPRSKSAWDWTCPQLTLRPTHRSLLVRRLWCVCHLACVNNTL